MQTIKNLIRLLSILALFLAASPTLANASQSASTLNKLSGDFRNFQNFGSLGHQPASQEELAASNSTGLEIIGHLGGYAYAVALDGSYAYLATDAELAVLDVSNPAGLVRVGYAAYPSQLGQINRLLLSNGRAYFISSEGMSVVDVSDPFKPAYLGVVSDSTNAVASGIAIYEDHAYMDLGSKIWIYDLSGPGLPEQVGSFSLDDADHISNILISGHFAYFVAFSESAGNPRLGILDLSNPTTPHLVGSLENLLLGVLAVQGDYAYIIAPDFPDDFPVSYLQIVDVSDPAHPSLIKTTEIGVNAFYISSLDALDQTLYITMASAHPTEGLLVYSLQDPTQPVAKGSVATQDGAIDVAISPDQKFAFVADYGRGLRVIGLSDPHYLVEVGAYDPPSKIRSIGMTGGYAFTSSDQYGIRSIDISDPSNPKTVGFMPAWDLAYDLHVDGNYAYAAEQFGGGVRIYDVTDPAHMKEIASVGDNFYRLVVGGGYLYAWASVNSPLSVIDIHNPYQPALVGSYNINIISDMALTGSKAYIAAQNYGCLIVDFSDPASPREEGKCSDDETWAIKISGHYAYMIIRDANANFYLRVLDISNPSVPEQLGNYAIHDNIPYSLSVAGDIALLYKGIFQNMLVVDVTDPHFPHRVDSFDNGYFDAAVIDGNNLYLGNDHGLYVMKLVPTLSGRVTDASLYPVQGATIQSSSGITAISGANGSYHLERPVAGSYTITPTMNGYTFDPSFRSVTLPADTTSQDFALLPEPVTITAAPGVTATLEYTGYQSDVTHFEIPSGAFSQLAQVIVTPTVEMGLPAWAFTGHAFELIAQDDNGSILDFDAPVTATIAYTDFDLRFVTDESKLALYYWDGNAWNDATTTCTPASAYTRNPSTNQISLPICQPGKYALYGPTHAILMPAVPMNFH